MYDIIELIIKEVFYDYIRTNRYCLCGVGNCGIFILVTSFITTIIFFVIYKLSIHKEICVLSKQFLNEDFKEKPNEELS
jgi:hypothetical protein